MKETLSLKRINGKDYYYLMHRENGKLITKYLGVAGSEAYKKYLLSLTGEGKPFLFDEAKRLCYEAGVPLVYREGADICFSYRNGFIRKIPLNEVKKYGK